MAYENQNKCLGCGISIPFVHEDADSEALLCDECLKEDENEEEDDKIIPLHGIIFSLIWLILIVILVLLFWFGHRIICSDHKDADTINSRLSDSEMFNK